MAEGAIASKEASILDELDSETVRKLLECPVCLDLPLPPIYVCNKGHIVCNNCQARTYACPLCREHYSTTTRGFVAEGIIEKCILRCKHSDHGCPLSMKGSEMVEHLEVCDYRPVKCVDCAGKLINFDDYEHHLLNLHRINGINQNRAYVIYSMNLEHQIAFGEKCCWPQYYLKAFDSQTFLLRLYATHWFVCAWVSLFGPQSDCAKYEAFLEFHPTSDDSVVHTWRGPVNHFRADQAKDIFLQGRGLITPMETLMQMAPVANDHAEWLYNIEILQVPEKNDSEENIDPPEENIYDNEKHSQLSVPIPQAEDHKPGTDLSSYSIDGTDSTTAGISASQQVQQSAPARIVCEPPQQTSAHDRAPFRIRTPRRFLFGSNNQLNSTTVLTPGPATHSPSTSGLAAAATRSVGTVSAQNSGLESTQNNISLHTSYGVQNFGNDQSNQSATSNQTVSAARASSRLVLNGMRRASPFSFLFRGENSGIYGITEDDWNLSSETEEE